MVAHAGRDLCEDTRYYSRQQGWTYAPTKDTLSLGGIKSETSKSGLSCATKGFSCPGERIWQGHLGRCWGLPVLSNRQCSSKSRGKTTWDLTMELDGAVLTPEKWMTRRSQAE